MLLEFQPDWSKIVDFLLIANFWASPIFFPHPLTGQSFKKPDKSGLTLILSVYFSDEFRTYFNYCRSLSFEETPDYAFLCQLFRFLFHQHGFYHDPVFDWVVKKNKFLKPDPIQIMAPFRVTDPEKT